MSSPDPIPTTLSDQLQQLGLVHTASELPLDIVLAGPGLEELFVEEGKRTWRYGFPPMHYPTHCTAHLISVSGERLTHVTCVGFGDDDPILKDIHTYADFPKTASWITAAIEQLTARQSP